MSSAQGFGAVAGLAVLLIAVALSACSRPSGQTASAPQVVSSSDSTVAAEDIPVEVLPDPLPAPYVFRDEVTIERPPVTETIYVVQPGDTLASIANRFCITLEEMQRLNNIVEVTQLSIGQELRIPIREGGCGAAAPVDADPSNSDEPKPQRLPGEIYVVREGDTLSAIAATFGITWITLMEYNMLSEAQAGNLQVGQTLIIPPAVEPEAPAPNQAEPSEPPG